MKKKNRVFSGTFLARDLCRRSPPLVTFVGGRFSGLLFTRRNTRRRNNNKRRRRRRRKEGITFSTKIFPFLVLPRNFTI